MEDLFFEEQLAQQQAADAEEILLDQAMGDTSEETSFIAYDLHPGLPSSLRNMWGIMRVEKGFCQCHRPQVRK